jgi:hypothetical protein
MVKVMQDQFLECSRCSEEFVFDVGEQNFFKEHGLEPRKICIKCKRFSKQRKEFLAELKDTKPVEFFCRICRVKNVQKPSEVLYFKKMGFSPRKVCKTCRKYK